LTSDIEKYVFENEGTEPTVQTCDVENSNQSIENFVFGTELDVAGKLIIPYPSALDVNRYLKVLAAGQVSWDILEASTYWGNILGTLSEQEDLQAALDAKVDKVTGYGLSQNDLTDALKATYDGYAAQISGKEDTGVAAGLMSTHLSTYAHGDIAHANRATLDLISAAFTTALKATYDGYSSTIADKEPALGNPSVTGYVLSSTDAGVRSWVAQSAVITNHSSLSQLDYASSGHTGFEPTVTKGNLTEATSSILTILGGTNAVIGSGTTIQVKQAATAQSGYLSSTDWNTFNNKSSFSGSYTDLSDKPTIPTALSELSEDSTHRIVTDAEKSTWNSKQAGNDNLTSVAALSYASTSFVKMTGANTFALDTNTYLTSLSGAVLTDQSTPQTIGATGARLAKLWATDITCTNAIAADITGNAATVTNATLTTALTVNTGTLTLTANVANTSVLTIGAGAVSVSGANTGDETQSTIKTKLGAAATDADGYLTSTNWNTFNNKQTALTFGIDNDNAVEIDSASVASGEYAKFTANGLESKSIAEVQSDLDVLTKTVEINAQTGTSYSLQSSDNGKLVTLNNAAAITLTVPASLGAGFNCQILQLGAGQVTVSPSSTTVNNADSHTKLRAQYSSASLVAYAADTFLLQGDTST
jgi:hypothetical protein